MGHVPQRATHQPCGLSCGVLNSPFSKTEVTLAHCVVMGLTGDTAFGEAELVNVVYCSSLAFRWFEGGECLPSLHSQRYTLQGKISVQFCNVDENI